VRYYTCPAICREPYRYALVRVRGREVSVSERQLRLPDGLRLFDVHTHTQYAYCGDDVSAAEVIRRARAFGLAGVCVTEHADQLYLAREEHAACHVYRDNDYWCAPRSAESERMPRYRRDVEPLRSDFVRLGLEIELDGLGRPAVRPSDLAGWDLLLGAVHWIPGGVEGRGLDEVKRAFMASAQKLLASGVHVLAHPFRFFGRNKLERPRDLYRPLARLLAQHGVAAEINFHTNEPDPEFFAVCIREGVRIALGSDAHELREVADLQPHLALLREAAGRHQVADLLWPVTAV
jgi:histidinol phosphatase-like PHP family hydrolase